MTPAIAICCTDKGQHAWTALGDLSIRALLRANESAVYGALAERLKDQCVWLDQLDPTSPTYRVHLRCPRCQRHVQWKHDTAVASITALSEAGVTQLDISHIP